MEPKSASSDSDRHESLDKPQADNCSAEDRREAMKKLGKYAAYTAPAMLMLLLPRKSLAQSIPK